jgi:hypothetical protein
MTTIMSFTQWFNIGSRNDQTVDLMSGLYHTLSGSAPRAVETFTMIYNQAYTRKDK